VTTHGGLADWDHEGLMRQSILLAERSREHGNHPFGALLAKAGEILLAAENTVNTDRDPTCHAEMNLIRRVVQRFDAASLAGSVLYASSEPCAMCAGAVYWSAIGAIVYGCSAEALARVTGGGLTVPCREILRRGKRAVQIVGPVLEEEALEAHQGFW